ncbi:MAG TPA: hypothetical protein VK889_04475, partial [Solirubrobacterales bacterium]|nr:hypothetical protein [Solirubrobacterales bacterium]
MGLCALAVHAAPAAALPDDRGWELVSPVEKNGGGIATPSEAGAGTTRAAAAGGAIAYASRASFAAGAGAAPFSDYIARRTPTGWVTENITPAHLTGAYSGSPYLAFSADLSKALMLNPARCPAGDPCLPGYRVRDNNTGQIVAELADPSEFEPGGVQATFFVEAGHLYREESGSTTDLTPAGGVDAFLGADGPGATAYYRSGGGIWRWRQGAGVTQILSVVPASALADASAVTAGVTADGNRLFFTTAARFPLADVNFAPDVYQWQVQGSGSCAKAGGCVDLISSGLAGTSTFVGASADGADVFFVTDRSLV